MPEKPLINLFVAVLKDIEDDLLHRSFFLQILPNCIHSYLSSSLVWKHEHAG